MLHYASFSIQEASHNKLTNPLSLSLCLKCLIIHISDMLLFHFSGEPTEQIHALPPCPFKVGNKVKVDMDPELLKVMQEGHGGWNPKMAEVSIRIKHRLRSYCIFSSP